MNKYCIKCGASVNARDNFCIRCGSKISAGTAPASPESKAESPGAASSKSKTSAGALCRSLISNPIPAQSSAGEMSFACGGGALSALNIPASPIKHIVSQAFNLFRNIKRVLKNKKSLYFTLAISGLWLILILLPKLGFNPLPVRFLSFVTFAQGGLSNNIFRIAGGVAGKGVVAYFLSSLITPLLKGQKPFKGLSKGIKSSFFSYKNISANILPLMFGAGVSLVINNFFAGYSSPYKGMAAISAMILSLCSAENSRGFLPQLFRSLINRSNNSHIRKFDIKAILAGISAGFALSIPLSFIPFVYIGYLLGAALFLASAVLLWSRQRKKKGAAA